MLTLVRTRTIAVMIIYINVEINTNYVIKLYINVDLYARTVMHVYIGECDMRPYQRYRQASIRNNALHGVLASSAR